MNTFYFYVETTSHLRDTRPLKKSNADSIFYKKHGIVQYFVAYSWGIPGEFPGNGEFPLICRGTRSPNGSRDSILPGGTIQSHQNIPGERFQHATTGTVLDM